MKLYPPQLESMLPAFYKNYDNIGVLVGANITIPFGLNRTVSASEIGKIAIKIRTTSTNTYISFTDGQDTTLNYSLDEGWATFNLDSETANRLKESQYYRIQIAFVDKNTDEVGYFSTVGIIKCIAKPTVKIEGYESDQINSYHSIIQGRYSQDTKYGDSTEKAYSYIFNLWDNDGNLIETSEEQIHDVTQDTASDSSYDNFIIHKELKAGKIYRLQYTVTTLNGLVISTGKYNVMKVISIEPEYNIILHGSANYDEGYIELTMRGPQVKYTYYEDGQEKTEVSEEICNGAFKIVRSSNLNDYSEWEEIAYISFNEECPSTQPIYDFTVEQGIQYQYAYIQYNIKNVESEKVYLTYTDSTTGEEIPTTIQADFEDMFIYDGERQLKVRFNPKVSSFKNTIPEQKMETIGSKYPFIFRNGVVSYKEFPLNGLISYQMDDAMLFLNDSELAQAGILEEDQSRIATNKLNSGAEAYHEQNIKIISQPVQVTNPQTGVTYIRYVPIMIRDKKIIKTGENSIASYLTTGVSTGKKIIRNNKNLDTNNIMGERYFKLKVLDWLTDGKVKLFRSPTEGNYLIRLLKVSMKPEDKLGRMLHSFSATAYEIDECTYDNLEKYHIITRDKPNDTELQFASVSYAEWLNEGNGFYEIPFKVEVITNLYLSDFAPGDIVKIKYSDNSEGEYIIGITGTLNLNSSNQLINKLYIKPNQMAYSDFSRSITYGFNGIRTSRFDAIKDLKAYTRVAEQFIGPKDNLLDTCNLFEQVYGRKNENGQIEEDFSNDVDKVDDLKDILLSKNYLNYNLDKGIEKFTVLDVQILHVHKRNLIPIYRYGVDKYAVTPFGNGYVNYNSIKPTYIKDGEINYAENGYLTLQPYSVDCGVNENDIQDIVLNNFDHTAILQVFEYIDEDWQQTDEYYDTYTNEWIDNYDPTFSINNGDNNIISLAEKEDMVLTNLGQIQKIQLGNGVIAEVTALMRIVDYSIEEDDIEVLAAKEAYLQGKEQNEARWEKLMLYQDKYQALTVQIEELNALNDEIEAQKQVLRDSSDASGEVKEVIIQQLKEYKQTLYNSMIEKINTICEWLKNTNIPLDIEELKIGKALIDYDMVENPINEFNIEDRILHLWRPTNLDNYINNFDHISKEEQEQIIAKNTELLDSLQDQIKLLDSQIQTYEGNAETEGTITYYSNQIEEIKNKIEQLKEAHNDTLTSLMNSLMFSILTDNKQFSDLTDSYIRDNAILLRDTIQKLKDIEQEKLDALKASYQEKVNEWETFTYSDDENTPWNEVEYYWGQEGDITSPLVDAVPANAAGALAILKEYKASIDENSDFSQELQDYLSENNDKNDRDNYYKRIGAFLYLKKYKTLSVNSANLDELAERAEALNSKIEEVKETDKFFNFVKYGETKITIKDTEYTIPKIIVDENSLNAWRQSWMPDVIKNDIAKIDEYNELYDEFIVLAELVKSPENRGDFAQDDLEAIEKSKEELGIVAENFEELEKQLLELEANIATGDATVETVRQQAIINTIREHINRYNKLQALQVQIENEFKTYINKNIKTLQNAYSNAYNTASQPINTKISEYANAIAVLDKIIIDPGIYNRLMAAAATASTAITDTYETDVESLRKEFLSNINNLLTDDGSTSTLLKDSTLDQLLLLVSDDYNRNAVKTLNSEIANYQKAKEDSEKTDYEGQIKIENSNYNTTLNNYQSQMKELEQQIDIVKNNQQSVLEQRAEIAAKETEYKNNIYQAQEKLLRLEDEEMLDNSSIFDKMLEKSHILDNMLILKNYIEALVNVELGFVSSISNAYAEVEKSEDYSNKLIELINIYEKELFSLCHKYNAIEEDLEGGIDGEHGLDNKYSDFKHFNLYDYNDILYLGLTKEEDIVALQNHTDPSNAKDELESKLLVGNEKHFGILRKEVEDNVGYYLAEIDSNADKFNPTPKNIVGTYLDWVRNYDAMDEVQYIPYEEELYDSSKVYYTPDGNVYIYKDSTTWQEDLQASQICYMTPPPIYSFTVKEFTQFYEGLDLGEGNNLLELDEDNKVLFIGENKERTKWEQLLGVLIHNMNEEQEEVDSLSALYVLESDNRENLIKYLLELVKFDELLQDSKGQSYLQRQKNKSDYQKQLKYWQDLLNNCNSILESWELEINEESKQEEKQRLIFLINLCNSRISYFNNQLSQLDTQADITYINAKEQYNVAKEIYAKSNKLLEDNYTRYEHKAKHYIDLLYNNTVGKMIPANVAITLPSGYNTNYDLGLAYAIQSYYRNKTIKTDIQDYGTALAQANSFIKAYNQHFNCFELVAKDNSYDNDALYYYEDLLTRYYYIDEKTWQNDITNKKVYRCIAYSLLEVLPTVFIPTTGSNKQQYQLVNNHYVKTNNKIDTYEIADNQGLQYVLSADNDYLVGLKTNYQETLALYEALIKEWSNLDANIEQLDILYNKRELNKQKLIAEREKYAIGNEEEVDIYQKLAEFLRILTIKYVDQVERRYELL